MRGYLRAARWTFGPSGLEVTDHVEDEECRVEWSEQAVHLSRAWLSAASELQAIGYGPRGR